MDYNAQHAVTAMKTVVTLHDLRDYDEKRVGTSLAYQHRGLCSADSFARGCGSRGDEGMVVLYFPKCCQDWGTPRTVTFRWT